MEQRTDSTLMSLISADNALFNSQLEALKSIPVVFPDTYQAPPQLLPTRIAVFNVSSHPHSLRDEEAVPLIV